MIDQKKLIPYVAFEFIGVLFAAYFIFCGNDPSFIQDLGFPIFFEGDANYYMAVLAFAAFAAPLFMFLMRSLKARKDG